MRCFLRVGYEVQSEPATCLRVVTMYLKFYPEPQRLRLFDGQAKRAYDIPKGGG